MWIKKNLYELLPTLIKKNIYEFLPNFDQEKHLWVTPWLWSRKTCMSYSQTLILNSVGKKNCNRPDCAWLHVGWDTLLKQSCKQWFCSVLCWCKKNANSCGNGCVQSLCWPSGHLVLESCQSVVHDGHIHGLLKIDVSLSIVTLLLLNL